MPRPTRPLQPTRRGCYPRFSPSAVCRSTKQLALRAPTSLWLDFTYILRFQARNLYVAEHAAAALLLLLRWLLSNSSSSSWVKKQVEKKDGLRSSKARNVMRGYREMGCNHQIGDSECEHHHTYLEFLLAVSYNWLQYQTPFFPPRLHLSSQ